MKKLVSVVAFAVGASLVLAGCGPTTQNTPDVAQTSGTTTSSQYNEDSWKTLIPENCQSFSDGCNTCTRALGGEPACTKMFCETYAEPKCLDNENTNTQTGTETETQITNPASEYCVAQWGTSEIKKDEDWSEYGVCKLANGEEKDEWEFYRASQAAGYLGLSVAEAQAKAKENGVDFRIAEEDGKANALTADLRPGRVNATVKNGKVTSVDIE